MTLTIEVAPETETQLKEEAARRGLPVAQVAGEMLDDLLQDKEDAEEARRILAETRPEEYIPWEQVKAEMQADRAPSNGARREAA